MNFYLLVPKLQLGNSVLEALASRLAKLVVVSYSKAFKKEAEILKIEPFNVTKSPNRWRYFRYEEE